MALGVGWSGSPQPLQVPLPLCDPLSRSLTTKWASTHSSLPPKLAHSWGWALQLQVLI